jgi:hypothetical protein
LEYGMASPRMAETSKTALVWPASGNSAMIPADLQAAIGDNTPSPTLIELTWKHLWRPLGYRTSSWGTAIIERTN